MHSFQYFRALSRRSEMNLFPHNKTKLIFIQLSQIIPAGLATLVWTGPDLSPYSCVAKFICQECREMIRCFRRKSWHVLTPPMPRMIGYGIMTSSTRDFAPTTPRLPCWDSNIPLRLASMEFSKSASVLNCHKSCCVVTQTLFHYRKFGFWFVDRKRLVV